MNVKSILYLFLLPNSLLAAGSSFFSAGTANKSGYTEYFGSYIFSADPIYDTISKMSQYFNNPAKILALSLVIASICCLLTFLAKYSRTEYNFKLNRDSFEWPLTFVFYTVFWASCFALPFIFNRQSLNGVISQFTIEHLKIYACTMTSVTASLIFVLFFIFFVPRLISHLAIIMSIALIFLVLQHLTVTLLNLALSFTFIILTICFLLYYIPRINSISFMLKSTAFVLIKNLSSILPTLLVLIILFQGQFVAIMMLVEYSLPFFGNSRFFLGGFLLLFAFSTLINFIIVFVTSKIYNSYSKGDTSFMFSLRRAISAMPIIVLLSFFYSGLKVLYKFIESLIDREEKKRRGERNAYYLLGLIIVNVILHILLYFYDRISEYYLIFVGAYGPDFDSERAEKLDHVIFDEDILVIRASNILAVLGLVFLSAFSLIFGLFRVTFFEFSLINLEFWSLEEIIMCGLSVSRILYASVFLCPFLLMFVSFLRMFYISIITGMVAKRNNNFDIAYQ